jgi:hypothetical protein
LTFPNSNYYISPTHKLSVVIEKLKLSIANFVFQIFLVLVNLEKMNFELATRVDNYTLEDLSAEELPAAEPVAATPAAEPWACIPVAATPAADTATAAVEDPASADAPTGYQLSLCWCR